MLRLWPETASVGLFPRQCWLQHGRRERTVSCAIGVSKEPGDLLVALEAILVEQGETLGKGSRLELLVSDSVGVIATLPWQEELTKLGELRGYAQACFERQGTTIDDAWVMRAEFRHHRAMGLAYALPRSWLEALIAIVARKGLVLKWVLPVSAMAYWCHRPRLKAEQGVILLREIHRTSALIYDRTGLRGIDVEPITSTGNESGTRLLRRVSASCDALQTVWDWSPDLPGKSVEPEFIKDCLSDAKVHPVCRDNWS